MDILHSLTEAVAELLEPRYPIPIENLYHILTRSTPLILESWCQVKACQVGPLLSCLKQRTRYRDNSVRCLVELLKSKTVVGLIARDDELIERICGGLRISNHQNFEHALRFCLGFDHGLDNPSPKAIPEMLVDQVDGDLWNLTSHFHAFPESAQEALLVITSAPSLLTNLNEKSVEVLFDAWKQVLKSNRHESAVVAVLAAQQLTTHGRLNPVSSFTTSEASSNAAQGLHEWMEKAASLFAGVRAGNVLDTLMLVTLKACSEGTSITDETLENCQTIICRLDKTVLESWSRRNLAIMEKVRAKAAQSHDFKVNAAAFRILQALLVPDLPVKGLTGELAQKLVTRLTLDHSILANAAHFETAQLLPSQLIHKVIHDTEEVRKVVRWTLAQCCHSEASIRRFRAIELAICWIESLLLSIQNEPGLATLIFDRLLEDDGCRDWWDLDLATPGNPLNCKAFPVCIHRVEERRKHLAKIAAFLLLQAAGTSDRIVQHDVVVHIRKQLISSVLTPAVARCQYVNQDDERQADEGSSPPLTNAAKWRADIRKMVKERNEELSNDLEYIMFKTCQDLQKRCDNVEQPLCAARAEVEDLTALLEVAKEKLERCYTEIDKLQDTVKERCLEVQALEERVDEANCKQAALSEELNAAVSRAVQIKNVAAEETTRLEKLLSDFQENARREADESHKTYVTKLSSLEDHLRSQSQAESNLTSENDWLRNEITRVKEELTTSHETAMGQLREQHAVKCSNLEGEIATLKQEKLQLKKELQLGKDQLAEREQASIILTTRLEETEAHAGRQTNTLQEQENKINTLLTNLQTAQEEAKSSELERQQQAEELLRRDGCITELSTSNADLQARCLAQAKALEKAKKAEQSVLAIFQDRGQPPASSSPATTVTLTPSQNPHNRRNSTDQLPEFSFLSKDDEDYLKLLKRP